MTAERILARLRRFLLALVAALCAGTIIELVLAEHTQELLQWVPLVLCAFGFVAALGALFVPQRTTLLALRICMAALLLGSLLGLYEHLVGNINFELGIRPNAVLADVWVEALRGASPLLAPGILGLTAVLALAATYYHPVLREGRQ